ncbi:MAG: CapA family protein [Clostridiales bacterium]|nr:CapA family protein [Clostridiales bacterium]
MKDKNDWKMRLKRIFFEHSTKGKFMRLGAFMLLGALLGCIIGPVRAATMDKSPASTQAEQLAGHGNNTLLESGAAENGESISSAQDSNSTGSGKDALPVGGAQNIKRVKLLAVGDDLIHSGLYKSGLKEDSSYNFDHLYENVKADIQAADLAIVNQETIFTYNRNDYSGYPCFAGPVEIGDALVDAGFDVVTHATNHVFDRNVQGIEDTLDFWKTNHPEITVLGIHENQTDADTIKTVERNGITFAMLNYTYGMNGFALPDDQPYLVDLLDREKVAADIAKAKEVSDCVIFFLHCGVEYTYDPSEETKEWVQFLLENGVDITIASHPHVLEPYVKLTREDGHEMLVYYSMGNFISTQDEYPRLIGGLAEITVELKGQGDNAKLSFEDYTLEPLYTHYNHNTGVYTVYKFSDYTDELALQNGLNGKNGVTLSRQVIWDEFTKIMTTEIAQPGAASVEQPWLGKEIPLPALGQSIADIVSKGPAAGSGNDSTLGESAGSSAVPGEPDSSGAVPGENTDSGAAPGENTDSSEASGETSDSGDTLDETDGGTGLTDETDSSSGAPDSSESQEDSSFGNAAAPAA